MHLQWFLLIYGVFCEIYTIMAGPKTSIITCCPNRLILSVIDISTARVGGGEP